MKKIIVNSFIIVSTFLFSAYSIADTCHSKKVDMVIDTEPGSVRKNWNYFGDDAVQPDSTRGQLREINLDNYSTLVIRVKGSGYIQIVLGAKAYRRTDVTMCVDSTASVDLYGDISYGSLYFAGGDGPDFVTSDVPSTIFGNGGNDALFGTRENDYIDGGNGNDYIEGYVGNDTLMGGDNKDFISRSTSRWDSETAYIDGGKGNDIIFSISSAFIYGGDGSDLIDLGNSISRGKLIKDADKSPDSFFSDAYFDRDNWKIDIESNRENNDSIVDGGPGDDIIRGSLAPDTIYGGDGNDNIKTWDSDDIIYGGTTVNSEADGDDIIVAGDGNDTIHGNKGNDKMYAGKGNDIIYGENGDDFIETYSGSDIADGNSGNDEIDDWQCPTKISYLLLADNSYPGGTQITTWLTNGVLQSRNKTDCTYLGTHNEKIVYPNGTSETKVIADKIVVIA